MSISFITILPDNPSTSMPWWHVEHGDIVARGEFTPGDDKSCFPAISGDIQIIALADMGNIRLNWVEMGDIPARQAETAARIKTAKTTLGHDSDNHIVAAGQADGTVLVATIAHDKLRTGLDILSRYDLDPDIILPAAMAITAPKNGFHAAKIGGAFLRGNKIALPDEPALYPIFVGDAPVTAITPAQLDAAITAVPQNKSINIRSGIFAKRNRTPLISAPQWRILGLLIFAALSVSLLLAGATLWKYKNAKTRENNGTLMVAKKIIPGAIDIPSAQAGLDIELQKRGLDRKQFSFLAARLFTLIKEQENVTLHDMQYSPDKIISANLAAPGVDQVNAILIALQADGYRVTATSLTDDSGLVIVNISMRIS